MKAKKLPVVKFSKVFSYLFEYFRWGASEEIKLQLLSF